MYLFSLFHSFNFDRPHGGFSDSIDPIEGRVYLFHTLGEQEADETEPQDFALASAMRARFAFYVHSPAAAIQVALQDGSPAPF
jgi:hypothetical protein